MRSLASSRRAVRALRLLLHGGEYEWRANEMATCKAGISSQW
jgi:hypothetical protein